MFAGTPIFTMKTMATRMDLQKGEKKLMNLAGANLLSANSIEGVERSRGKECSIRRRVVLSDNLFYSHDGDCVTMIRYKREHPGSLGGQGVDLHMSTNKSYLKVEEDDTITFLKMKRKNRDKTADETPLTAGLAALYARTTVIAAWCIPETATLKVVLPRVWAVDLHVCGISSSKSQQQLFLCWMRAEK